MNGPNGELLAALPAICYAPLWEQRKGAAAQPRRLHILFIIPAKPEKADQGQWSKPLEPIYLARAASVPYPIIT